MKLPKLFKITSTGALQEWEICVLGNEPQPDGRGSHACIVTSYGQVGGKIQSTSDIIKEGKNIGKSNETSPFRQAQAEAQSQWEKKLKKGYVLTVKSAEAGEVDDVIEGGVFPMLAKKFSEQGEKIEYPAFVQPKFDGHRCIAVLKGGKCTLWSRTRKPITGLPHIIKVIEELGLRRDYVFDGELYHHDYRNKFEELTSFIRNPVPKDGHEVVQYHVYDIAGNGSFRFRNGQLDLMHLYEPLVRVHTQEVQDEDELMEAFDSFRKAGYEGAMVRNAAGDYVNKRSNDLQKIKEFDDDEFVVTSVSEGRGKMAGCAIFSCENAEGTEFDVKMRGKIEDLKQYVKNPDLCLGRMLTVKYQGLTKTGKPRFPIGERFKDDL